MFLPENLFTTLILLQTLITEERHDTDEFLQRPSASSSKLLLYLFLVIWYHPFTLMLLFSLFLNPPSAFASSPSSQSSLHLINWVFLAGLVYTQQQRGSRARQFSKTSLCWNGARARPTRDRGTFVPAAQKPSQVLE